MRFVVGLATRGVAPAGSIIVRRSARSTSRAGRWIRGVCPGETTTQQLTQNVPNWYDGGMANAHLDHPGEIRWFRGYGPRPVLGPCHHHNCRHLGVSVIADGPSYERYVLVQCDGEGHPRGGPTCQGWCRAWQDHADREVTPWLMVKALLGGDLL